MAFIFSFLLLLSSDILPSSSLVELESSLDTASWMEGGWLEVKGLPELSAAPVLMTSGMVAATSTPSLL